MSDIKIEIKRSKVFTVFGVVLSFCVAIFFVGGFVFVLIDGFNMQYESNAQRIEDILIGGGPMLLVIILCIVFDIFFIRNSIRKVDVYTKTKMYQKKGDNIMFEIEYSNIASVKQGYFSVFLLCEEMIVNKKNNKPLFKTYMEHYSKKDIEKILKIISEYDNQTKEKNEQTTEHQTGV